MLQLVFNEFNNINEITKTLRRTQYSLKNRLNSILYDYYYILSITQILGLPIISNERCGLWYIPSNLILDTCYFKSTDGHTNVWSFSLRRLNLNLIPLIKQNNGLIIIDSTRKGKLMPDSLLKTIPIWCAVINSILTQKDWLKLPSFIPLNEQNSIKKLLPNFISQVKQLNLLDGYKLDKPIIPKWYYPGSNFDCLDEDVYNLCLISASTIHNKSFDYIQGAADDHELWIPQDLKFDYNIFWQLIPEILHDKYIEMNEDELIESINQVSIEKNPFKYYTITDKISIGKIENDLNYQNCCMIVFSDFKILNQPENANILQYSISSNKKGSNKLRTILPELINKITFPCMILCDSGKDLSCGILLILLCLNYDLNWEQIDTPSKVTKDLIKQHLAKISLICKVNPSRSTLQAINSYLFESK